MNGGATPIADRKVRYDKGGPAGASTPVVPGLDQHTTVERKCQP